MSMRTGETFTHSEHRHPPPPMLLQRDTTAWIYRPSLSPNATGKANGSQWVLRFEPRWGQTIEPLMGWAGGGDPLEQIELRFPTREAAVAYAERQGLSYVVCDPGARPASDRRQPGAAAALHCVWTRPATASVDLEAALRDPAAVFASPGAVLTHPRLTRAQKRRILTGWAWDERLIELAEAEAMPEGKPSRLDEVLRALLALESSAPDRPPREPVAAPIPRLVGAEEPRLAA